MARVLFVGLPGVGKSAIAAQLGIRWGCEVVDTDYEVAQRAGIAVAELLRTHGEAALRALENDVLDDVVARDVVVATGGGIVTTASARALLRAENTIWLDCPDDVVLTRLGDGDRPLLGDDWAASLSQLRAHRTPWYEEVSRHRVDTSGELADVVTRVAATIETTKS
ncbi:MAG: shikimate kinase [Acidobacteriota bacterium]|nr:shikimate kinase [Acidobacteriota bacterium]MDE3043753.1 shikimate kinase [Acidobacteriota bacterium]MDE3222511.1 shikimate kinase [Acidobacteriota bacterium]